MNYVQWQTVDDYQAFVDNDQVRDAMSRLNGRAGVDPRLYTVVRTMEGRT